MNAAPTDRYIIALTGGVAAGKSAVEKRFAALGVPVHDADRAAREVVAPNSEGLAAIVQAFGTDVLDASGQLDRPRMRQRIFTDTAARTTLEGITHPRVRAWLRERALADNSPYSLLSIPLLARNLAHYDWINRVLVVDAPVEIQLARLLARDSIDAALAQRMLAQQASREERLALAHDVIDNSGAEAALDATVAALHRRYLALAAGR